DLVERVRSAVEEVEGLVLSFGHRLALLPAVPVVATRDDVGTAAAAALGEGIAEEERALHAAQWIEVHAGLRALATALTSSDTYRFWEVRVERFVATFEGADRQLARSIAQQAGVADLSFAELTDGQVARLAAVLRWARW
ncbi:MAG TPA: hypothetical protein VK509_01765, partial [Polyangiales bacterium]|nr:hypothetical protein [Polyangiales bacterium]